MAWRTWSGNLIHPISCHPKPRESPQFFATKKPKTKMWNSPNWLNTSKNPTAKRAHSKKSPQQKEPTSRPSNASSREKFDVELIAKPEKKLTRKRFAPGTLSTPCSLWKFAHHKHSWWLTCLIWMIFVSMPTKRQEVSTMEKLANADFSNLI